MLCHSDAALQEQLRCAREDERAKAREADEARRAADVTLALAAAAVEREKERAAGVAKRKAEEAEKREREAQRMRDLADEVCVTASTQCEVAMPSSACSAVWCSTLFACYSNMAAPGSKTS